MYGIFSYNNTSPRVGLKHGTHILDLQALSQPGHFNDLGIDPSVFAQPALNDFIALGKSTHRLVRQRLNELLADDGKAFESVQDQVLIDQSRATMHLPVRIGNYTDFYAGIHHAENVGRIFRPDAEPLLPNYRHLPVAYHGRASSIVVSGTPITDRMGRFWEPPTNPFLGRRRRWILSWNWG